jgi:hypothetical protein
MADKKISALTVATTPLAGTEVLPIVQGGATVKVANNDLRPKQIQSNATSGVLQVAGPAAAAIRVMTTPDANFTAARTDAGQTFTGTNTFSSAPLVSTLTSDRVVTAGASGILQDSSNFTFDGTNTRNTTFAMPTVTGGRADLLAGCLVFAGQTFIPSPYSQNLQIDITWGDISANRAIALVEVAIVAREWATTAGCAFGWLYSYTSASTPDEFTQFVTTGVTAFQGALTATSGGSGVLRITFNPTNNTDIIGYQIRIPSITGGTGATIASIAATIV